MSNVLSGYLLARANRHIWRFSFSFIRFLLSTHSLLALPWLRIALCFQRCPPGFFFESWQLQSGMMLYHADAVLASSGSRADLGDRSSVALFLQLLPQDSTLALARLPLPPQRPRRPVERAMAREASPRRVRARISCRIKSSFSFSSLRRQSTSDSCIGRMLKPLSISLPQ